MRPQKMKACLPELCGCHLAWQSEQDLKNGETTGIPEHQQIDSAVNPLVKTNPNKPWRDQLRKASGKWRLMPHIAVQMSNCHLDAILWLTNFWGLEQVIYFLKKPACIYRAFCPWIILLTTGTWLNLWFLRQYCIDYLLRFIVYSLNIKSPRVH